MLKALKVMLGIMVLVAVGISASLGRRPVRSALDCSPNAMAYCLNQCEARYQACMQNNISFNCDNNRINCQIQCQSMCEGGGGGPAPKEPILP